MSNQSVELLLAPQGDPNAYPQPIAESDQPTGVPRSESAAANNRIFWQIVASGLDPGTAPDLVPNVSDENSQPAPGHEPDALADRVLGPLTEPGGAPLAIQKASSEKTASRQRRMPLLKRAVAALTTAASVFSAVPGPSSGEAFDAPLPPSIAASATSANIGSNYSWVGGEQTVAATGASVELMQNNPHIDGSDLHSLAELSVQSINTKTNAAKNGIEVGWQVNRILPGDGAQLFVYDTINGKQECYNGCGFVSESKTVVPGEHVKVNTMGKFAIDYAAGKWQISYNGTKIGYYPASLWSRAGGFTKTNFIQTFGEVETYFDSNTNPDCTQMGNGLLGKAYPHRGQVAGFALQGTKVAPNLTPFETTGSNKTSTNYRYANVTRTGMTFGGPVRAKNC